MAVGMESPKIRRCTSDISCLIRLVAFVKEKAPGNK
jgi:hypothetical protein